PVRPLKYTGRRKGHHETGGLALGRSCGRRRRRLGPRVPLRERDRDLSQQPALLFPYTMVIAALVGSIPAAALAIAAGQYPAYGVLIAQARRPGSKMLAVVAAHAV